MSDLPQNSELSRYFGDLQTMMTWLDRLGGLYEVNAGTKYIAVLPSAYDLNIDFDYQRRMMAGEKPGTIDGIYRDKRIPTRYEVSSDSRIESLCTLAQSVLDRFNRNSRGRIYLHQPKPESPKMQVAPYFCVRKADPWHDHASEEQFHLTIASYDRANKEILHEPFEKLHVHLIHPDLVW